MIADILFTIGAAFIMLAGFGLLKMPDFLTRMQAVSKASTVGVLFMLGGSLILNPSTESFIKGTVIGLVLLLTAPLGTHVLCFAYLQKLKEKQAKKN